VPLIKIKQFLHSETTAVVISARVHPGESPGSFICEGLIKKLLEFPQPITYYIVPMLNPDGVVAGNSRTSLAGVDLNRRWGQAVLSKDLHPPIYALKNLLKKVRPLAFIDLHAHTKAFHSFFYGNSGTKYDPLIRLLPKYLSKQDPMYSYANSDFKVNKDRENTGRVVGLRELGILYSYTLETSFFGYKPAGGGKGVHKFTE